MTLPVLNMILCVKFLIHIHDPEQEQQVSEEMQASFAPISANEMQYFEIAKEQSDLISIEL